MHASLSIAPLIPPAAAVAELPEVESPGAQFAALLPEEARTLGPVSDARGREFARGRACARLAMQKLGVGSLPLLRGSITHCDGYCAAVVGRMRDLRTIGIDAEPIRAFGDVVLDRIALAGERAWMSGADAQVPWAVVLFSAKESVFKAWFPVFESALDFSHVRIDFDPPRRAFRAIVRRNIRGAMRAVPFVGRYRFDRARVLTSAYLEVDAPAIGDRGRPASEIAERVRQPKRQAREEGDAQQTGEQ
jgi:4'-phosphopantetheinyl transferase EntD